LGHKKPGLVQVTDAGSKPESKEVHHAENVIGEPGGVGVMLLDAHVGLVIEETVEHISGIPDADVDHHGAERGILVGEVGVKHPAGIVAILRIDVPRAFRPAAGLEPLTVRGGGCAVAPVGGEGMPELGVDQIGQRGGIGVVADVPSLRPREFGPADAGSRRCHFNESEIDGIGQNGGEEKRFVFDWGPQGKRKKLHAKGGWLCREAFFQAFCGEFPRGSSKICIFIPCPKEAASKRISGFQPRFPVGLRLNVQFFPFSLTSPL